MEEITITDWDEFKNVIRNIRSRYGSLTNQDGTLSQEKNIILFRGQPNSTWPLKTTLERKTKARFHISKYYHYAFSCVPEIESYNGYKWGMKNLSEILDEIDAIQSDLTIHLPNREYLIYLRHHGFPSPFLDWTQSPYIAAFFAVSEQNGDETSAVYAFIERTNRGKPISPSTGRIKLVGPYISTDKRHFSQKAWYTIATQWDEEENKHYFCSYDGIFANPNKYQDILVKIILPPSEKKKALIELEDYNINYYSLFLTEDYLVKALVMKKFDLEEI